MLTQRLRQAALAGAMLLCMSVVSAAEQPHGEQPSLFAGSLGNSIVTLIIFGLVVFILGLLVSIYPAVKAARFTPVEALAHT